MSLLTVSAAILLLIGLGIGLIIGYFLMKRPVNLENRLLKNEVAVKNSKIESLTTDLAKLSAELAVADEKTVNLRKEIDETKQKMTLEFKNLANQIFEEKSKSFSELNKTNLGLIVNPLQEYLKELREKLENESKEKVALDTKISTELKNLIDLNKKMSEEATNLTKALKGNNKIAGNWGEEILEQILEKSGLTKGREYFLQYSIAATNEEGKKIPDALITLPDNKIIVVDSKVSLVAYEAWSSAEEKGEKERYLKEHADSVKKHIDELAKKDYPGRLGQNVQVIDFTMLFLPIETMLSAAILEKAELWSYAYEKRILLVTPTSFIVALKIISDIWRREKQNKNIQELFECGNKIYEKFVGFLESMDRVGKNLDDAKKSWDDANKKLREGRGNLVDQLNNLKSLGVKSSKSIAKNQNKIEQLPLNEVYEESRGN